jgi:hypothetical protein
VRGSRTVAARSMASARVCAACCAIRGGGTRG